MTFDSGLNEEFAVPDDVLPVVREVWSFIEDEIIPFEREHPDHLGGPLAFLDADAVDRARDRWVTPDATVETNGPLAVVARPAVVDRVARELASSVGTSPTRLGAV